MFEGNFFLKIGQWLTPTIKGKKVTYSNSSLKLWKERKYAIELITVKNYNNGLVFLMAKTLTNISNHSLKLAIVFSKWPIPFEANTSLYSNASQYSGDIKACKKFAPFVSRSDKTLWYYKLTDSQIHHLLKFQGIHEICRKVQEYLRYGNSMSIINVMFNSMFNIVLVNK